MHVFCCCFILADATKQVAFHARLTSSPKASAGSIIRFDTLFLNIGHGFDSNTGIFTAPYSGTYMFLIYVDISSDYRAFHLSKNGSDVIACDNDGGMRRITCGLTISLNIGDTIYPRHYNNDGSLNGGANSFFGFKIF